MEGKNAICDLPETEQLQAETMMVEKKALRDLTETELRASLLLIKVVYGVFSETNVK